MREHHVGATGLVGLSGLLMLVLLAGGCFGHPLPNDHGDAGNLCGNGIVEPNETCDGNCPTSCDDGDACTSDVMTGSPATCDVRCSNTPITTCVSGDGCCPQGCNNGNDWDCKPFCGDGVVEPPETCDGNCPTSCDDGDPCTNDSISGSPSMCDVQCSNVPITACVSGDGCCPPGCVNDLDCLPGDCGDGIVQSPPETCDGNCPTSCDDGDACTNDVMAGSPAYCNVLCSHDPITTCVSGDGCCPAGCDSTTDTDCAPS